MLRRALTPATVALLTFLSILVSFEATAAAQRTFVATTGNDANVGANCSLALPCRSFGAALGVTSPNGELVVVDSGGYGRVTINTSVAITAPAGVYAGISVFSGTNGVDIAGPGIRVVLRGLTINGQGGDSGISISSGNDVVVERSAISNMTVAGVEVQAPTEPLRLSVADTVFTANQTGVNIQGGSQNVIAVLLRTRIERSAHSAIVAVNNVDVQMADGIVSGSSIGTGFPAISAVSSFMPVRFSLDAMQVIDNGSRGMQINGSSSGDVRATITRSTIARNAAGGLVAQTTAAGASADLLLASSTVADNIGIGVSSFSSAGSVHIVVAESNIVNNTGVGMAGTSGTFYTRGNNTLRGNNGAEISSQTSGTITLLGGS